MKQHHPSATDEYTCRQRKITTALIRPVQVQTKQNPVMETESGHILNKESICN